METGLGWRAGGERAAKANTRCLWGSESVQLWARLAYGNTVGSAEQFFRCNMNANTTAPQRSGFEMAGTVIFPSQHVLWPLRQGLFTSGGRWTKGFQEGEGCQVPEKSAQLSGCLGEQEADVRSWCLGPTIKRRWQGDGAGKAACPKAASAGSFSRTGMRMEAGASKANSFRGRTCFWNQPVPPCI